MVAERVAGKGYALDELLSKANDRKVAMELKELMEVDEKEFCENGLLYYMEMLLNDPELILERKLKRLRELFSA